MSDNKSAFSFFKPSDFYIIFPKAFKKFQFYVQEVNIPGFSLGGIQVSNMAQFYEIPGDNIVWSPLSTSLILNESMESWFEVLNHLITIKNPETGEIDWQNAIMNIDILLSNNKFNQQYICRFYDAWFNSISDLNLSTILDNDVNIIVNADITYSYYEFINYKDKKSLLYHQ